MPPILVCDALYDLLKSVLRTTVVVHVSWNPVPAYMEHPSMLSGTMVHVMWNKVTVKR